MRCFYHQDREAVGSCKSCGKGVCAECAVDLGKGLACRNRCEDAAKALIQLIDRNLQLVASPTKAHLVVPPSVQRTGQPTDYIAAQLTSHIRETRNQNWMLGVFCMIVGIVLLVVGIPGHLVALDIIGGCSVAFSIILLIQARHSAARPRLAETQTR
jgi:hypothetical protein